MYYTEIIIINRILGYRFAVFERPATNLRHTLLDRKIFELVELKKKIIINRGKMSHNEKDRRVH